MNIKNCYLGFPSACGALLCVALAQAHDDRITHPSLSDNAIDILNHLLINRFRSDIRQGSIDEDALTRFCYHAYNPVNGRGWTDLLTGTCDVALIAGEARTAAVILFSDAVTAYRNGNRQGVGGSFHLLGRSLHLLQDMTSPAHVHSDIHLPTTERLTDDFEKWGPTNFRNVSGVGPVVPGDGAVATFIHELASFTYTKSTFSGVIDEVNPQLDRIFSRMFPTLVYNDGGLFGDDFWHIDNVGDFENFPNSNDWWASDNDSEEQNPGPRGVRRISGKFYIENSGGNDGRLTPEVWEGDANTKTLLEIYGEELFPETVRFSAGFLQRFAQTVCPAPVAGFSGSIRSGCAPLTVQFNDQSTGDFLQTWRWDFGDGSTSAARNPSHIYATTGNYTVSLTVTSDCGQDTETKTNFVAVQAGSLAQFTATPRSGCYPHSVQFTDQSTGTGLTTWFWEFGDGITSVQRNPSHTYTLGGTYTVRLTVTGACGQDVESKSGFISVVQPPLADFTGLPRSDCVPLTVQFTDRSSGDGLTSWQWTFGDGTTSTQQNPQHAYATPGLYSVQLTVRSDCGQNSLSKSNYIDAVSRPPTSDFGTSTLTTGCLPFLVQFTDRSTGDAVFSWDWNFGDGSTSTERNPSHTYQKAGVFSVSLAVRDRCGQDIETKAGLVTVRSPHIVEFSANPTAGCSPLAVRFTDASVGDNLLSRRWDFGDGSISTQQHPHHSYQKPGRYTVALTVAGQCGEVTERKTDYIQLFDSPLAAFAADTETGCAPLTVALTDASTGHDIHSRHWDFGDGTTSTAQNPTHRYEAPGVYSVALRVTGSCGDDEVSKVLEVLGPPDGVAVISCAHEAEALFVEDSIEVCWPAAKDATDYVVEARTDPGAPWFMVSELPAEDGKIEYCDTLIFDTEGSWTVRVMPENDCGVGTSAECGPIEVRPPATVARWSVACVAGIPIAQDVDRGHSAVIQGKVDCSEDRFSSRDAALHYGGSGESTGDTLPVVIGDFTVALWVETSEIGDSPQTVLEIQGLGIDWAAANGRVTARLGDTVLQAESVSSAWHHVLVTRNGESVLFYIDGVEERSAVNLQTLGSSYSFGRSLTGGGFLHGKLDEVLYERRFRSASAVTDLLLEGGPTVALSATTIADRSLLTGAEFEGLRIVLHTGVSPGGGGFVLEGLRITAQELTGTQAEVESVLDHVSPERLVLCDESGQDAVLGTLQAGQPSSAGKREYDLLIESPYHLSERRAYCIAAVFDLDNAAPPGRVVQFGVEVPEHVEVLTSNRLPVYVAGSRRRDSAAVEGDRLTTAQEPAPPVVVKPPVDSPVEIEGQVEVLGAILHTITIQSSQPGTFRESISVDRIVYTVSPDATLDGVQSPTAYADLNGDGQFDDSEQLGPGTPEGRRLVVTPPPDMSIDISQPVEILLKADLKPEKISTASAGVFRPRNRVGYLCLGVLAISLLTLVTIRGRAPRLHLISVTVCLCLLIVVCMPFGCGGKGGGGAEVQPEKGSVFQVGIMAPVDFQAKGSITKRSVPVELPPNGILGNRFKVTMQ